MSFHVVCLANDYLLIISHFNVCICMKHLQFIYIQSILTEINIHSLNEQYLMTLISLIMWTNNHYCNKTAEIYLLKNTQRLHKCYTLHTFPQLIRINNTTHLLLTYSNHLASNTPLRLWILAANVMLVENIMQKRHERYTANKIIHLEICLAC